MKIISGIAAAIVGLTLPFSFVSPAEAECVSGCGSYFYHPNDTGYDKSLIILCNDKDTFADRRFLREGKDSNEVCPDRSVDAVWVRKNEEWWCESAIATIFSKKHLTFDRTGKHTVDDEWFSQCVVQKD